MRRITKGKISFLSFCRKGKNRLPTIFKEDGGFQISMLAKEIDEEGVIYAIVYAPEVRDADGDIASRAVIKDMAYSAARDRIALDMRHDCKPLAKEQAFIAEHFIVQKGDPRFEGLADYDGNPVDPEGSWGVVVKIDDPKLRSLYRSGEWGGVSMFGTAEVVPTSKSDDDDLANRIADRLLAKKLNSPEEEDTMTNEQIQALAKAITDGVVAGISKAAPEAPETKPEASPVEAPVFKGDATSAEAVKAYRDEVRKHDLQQKLAKATTTAEVDSILADLAKAEADEKPETEELKLAKADLAKATEKLRKLEGHSRQPTPAGPAPSGSQIEGLSKADQDASDTGLAMANYANSLRA